MTGTKNNTELLGISLKSLSVLGFAIMSGVIKYLNDSIPLGQVVFFRSLVALVPLLIFLMFTSDFPAGLQTKHPWKHVRRCLLGTLAMFFTFATLRYLPIAEATAITYLSPVILVILAVIFLKEKVSPRRLWGVIFGICGLAIMTLPNFSASADSRTMIGIVLAIGSAVLIAAALIQVRQLSLIGENPGAIAFYFALTSTLVSAISLLGGWVQPTGEQLLCLISIGLLGGIAQILMTLAFKYAEASAMASYDYLSIVWAVIIGLLVFDEIPSPVFWVAMPLILFGALIAKPKSQKKLNKNRT